MADEPVVKKNVPVREPKCSKWGDPARSDVPYCTSIRSRHEVERK